jgi:very-short-patch-repair endonuclease
MATYPVILYPRLIADFRKSSLYSKNVKNSSLPGLEVPAPRKKTERKFSSRRAFIQRVLGSALILLGIFSLTTPIGLLAIATGTVALFVPVIQRFLLRDKASKSVVYFPEAETLKSTALQDYLSMLQATLRGKVLLPDGVTDAPVGASERVFGKFLEKYFPGRVNAQFRMQIPNWEGAYSTDFSVSFPELGVWIDVEIDEPYDYKTNKPTHCISDDRDRNRNAFFLNNNWIVIRFAEEQVVRFPESCCKEIALVIASVTKLNVYSKSLETFASLKPLPMWTHSSAKKMAKANYRDKYLKLVASRV